MTSLSNGGFTLLHGDCLDRLPGLAEDSVDAIVTDPPYGLGFMGKSWDKGVPGVEFWREMLRGAKPGAYLLAFGGARTFHRMACVIEDAGWEIRDTILWLYGSGFPKSHNLGDGRGTALKPAHEPIIMARKPLVGTVAANVLAYGTGALNIDGCRVPTKDDLNGGAYSAERKPSESEWVKHGGTIHSSTGRDFVQPLGRWPANVIHDGSGEVLAAFPEAPGQQGDLRKQDHAVPAGNEFGQYGPKLAHPARIEADKSAARFFYCAKASKTDRGEGNSHPTVKPTDLMRYLCRLVTPPGGVVLDPFAGSGSTGKAAMLEGFRFIGIEREGEYIEIARSRIAAVMPSNDNIIDPEIEALIG